MRLSPLAQRTSTPQRTLSPSDAAKVARLSREMALFTRLQGGAAPQKAALSPGTPAFAQAARKDYADLLELHQAPRLSPSFVVRKLDTLPAPVAAAFDSFRQLHAGHAELALSTIDGHRTWQAQVVQKGGAQVLLLDVRGSELARGVVRGAAVSWRW